MTMTPNTPQELLDQVDLEDRTYDLLSELSPVELHRVTQTLLSYLKNFYEEKFEETGDNRFLWDGCKVGTCGQVFHSLIVMGELRKEQEDSE